MYRPRRPRDLPSALTLGGRIPAAVGLLLLLILVASLGAVFFPAFREWTALESGSIVSGQVWRLVTWPLVQSDPMGLIFGGLVVYFFAPALAYEMGERRFLGTLLGISVATALITLLVSALLGVPVLYQGIWPVVDALVILWALRHPDQQVLIYFVLPVSGRVLAWITVGTNALFLLWAVGRAGLVGLVALMPPVAATAIAWAIAGGRIGVPRRWRLQWRDWALERQLRSRSRHLKVVQKDRDGNDGPPQWLN